MSDQQADFLKYQQQRESEYKWQFAGVLVDLVESQILTVDEARAVLGYEPHKTVRVTLDQNWTSTAIRSNQDVTQFGGSK